MFVTLAGIVMLSRFEHPENVYDPIVVIFDCEMFVKLTVVSLLQL